MGFYREMGDIMKKHELEELELKYDEMFNKILEKGDLAPLEVSVPIIKNIVIKI